MNLGPIVNTPYVDSCVAISKNGLSLFFSSTRQSPGTTNRDLYVTLCRAVRAGVSAALTLFTQRAAAGWKVIRSRVPVAWAKRSRASVEGRTFPPSIRAT